MKACGYGCYECGGRDGGPHTGACCHGAACAAPQAERMTEQPTVAETVADVMAAIRIAVTTVALGLENRAMREAVNAMDELLLAAKKEEREQQAKQTIEAFEERYMALLDRKEKTPEPPARKEQKAKVVHVPASQATPKKVTVRTKKEATRYV